MTARGRLLAVRRELVTALASRAVLAAAAVGMLGVAIARAVGGGMSVIVVAMMVALVTGVALGRPVLRARSLQRVALWVEERDPALRYAVVTAADGGASEAVERQALATPWWREARLALARIVAPAALAAALALAALLALPPRTDGSRALAAAGTAIGGPSRAARAADPLARVRAVVVPPAYAGRSTSTLDDPTSIDALVASRLTISGEGDATAVSALVDSVPRTVRQDGARWTLTLGMPGRPALVRLRSRVGARDRLIVLAPVIDAPPAVLLEVPARDTVVRAATGSWPLRARLRDDIGLRDARFELVVSSGEGENFTFRSATIAATVLGGARDRTLDARVSLDSLALKPGDVLQLRAVARDGNTATGPGVGSSDTRSVRVARVGEYDSVSVDPAPPGEPDGQVVSQRMLIILTEALERRRRRIARPVLLAEARKIAADQARLRKRVGDIVFQRIGGEPLSEHADHAGHEEHASPTGKLTPEELLKLADQATTAAAGAALEVEGDETPILAVSKPLLEAFNAMWDAGRALEQGETDRALPPMRRALAAIERARQAERIYLRGRPSAVVVDVARARLAGKDKGESSVREARVAADPVTRRRAAAFARATALLATDPAAAADTLLVLRVEALETAPVLAAALDDASRAARRGDGEAITVAWRRVRRALGPAPTRGDAVGLWSGAP